MDNILFIFALKGLVAFGCGFVLGLERELKGKPAGLRTSILICIGATLFTAIGYHVALSHGHGDPTRVFAQIVTGVGFLGAGAIMQRNGSINGLTTASTIWITSAIGVAIGVNYELIAIYYTLATLGTLVLLRIFENKVLHKSKFISHAYEINIKSKKQGVRFETIEEMLSRHGLILISNNISTTETSISYDLKAKGSNKHYSTFIEELSQHPSILKTHIHKI